MPDMQDDLNALLNDLSNDDLTVSQRDVTPNMGEHGTIIDPSPPFFDQFANGPVFRTRDGGLWDGNGTASPSRIVAPSSSCNTEGTVSSSDEIKIAKAENSSAQITAAANAAGTLGLSGLWALVSKDHPLVLRNRRISPALHYQLLGRDALNRINSNGDPDLFQTLVPSSLSAEGTMVTEAPSHIEPQLGNVAASSKTMAKGYCLAPLTLCKRHGRFIFSTATVVGTVAGIVIICPKSWSDNSNLARDGFTVATGVFFAGLIGLDCFRKPPNELDEEHAPIEAGTATLRFRDTEEKSATRQVLTITATKLRTDDNDDVHDTIE